MSGVREGSTEFVLEKTSQICVPLGCLLCQRPDSPGGSGREISCGIAVACSHVGVAASQRLTGQNACRDRRGKVRSVKVLIQRAVNAKPTQIWQKWPEWTEFAPTLVKIGRYRPELDEFATNWPKLPKIDRNPSKLPAIAQQHWLTHSKLVGVAESGRVR